MSPQTAHDPAVNVLFQNPIDSVEWPFEQFPPPPPDGHWIPKFAPPPPSKFPPLLSDVPSKLTLDSPVMALTYPPPPPLSEHDPTWLNQMLADVMRQRSHLETSLSVAQADVANAYAEAGLADAELEEERSRMQAFLDMVAKVAGSGFIRRMLEDVEQSVEVMSRPGDDSEDESSSSSSGSNHSPRGPAV